MTAIFAPTLDFDGEYEVTYANARTGYSYRVPWSSIVWGRKRGDISEATVTTVPIDGPASLATTEVLRALEPWTCELLIHRDGTLVWAGPVTGFSRAEWKMDAPATVEIRARDASAVLRKRLVAVSRTFSNVDLASGMAETLMADAYAVSGSRYVMTRDIGACGVTGSRSYTPSDGEMVLDCVGDLADRGFSWTVIGRTFVANNATLQAASGRCGVFTERAFASLPAIDVDGTEQANYFWALSGTNVASGAYSSVDSAVGLLQRVESRDELRNNADAVKFAQEQYTRYRFPLMSIGQATLSSRAPIAFDDLIPGVNVSLSFEESAMLGVADVLGVVRFGLETVTVEVAAGDDGLQERVSVSLGYQTEGVS